MYAMTTEDFEAEVAQLLARLPPEITKEIKNVAFGVEDGWENPNLLGLYQGIPRTRRGASYAFTLPDRITIFRMPILSRCVSRDEVARQVEITVKHEIGHYFGISEDRLHELGWA
jgi:predicted Zn-dependent protease with MMP-like domain